MTVAESWIKFFMLERTMFLCDHVRNILVPLPRKKTPLIFRVWLCLETKCATFFQVDLDHGQILLTQLEFYWQEKLSSRMFLIYVYRNGKSETHQIKVNCEASGDEQLLYFYSTECFNLTWKVFRQKSSQPKLNSFVMQRYGRPIRVLGLKGHRNVRATLIHM